tara:strand:- start:514 stop:1053 length:540 start_codon:yes stop_codon:yes gene_type:complete
MEKIFIVFLLFLSILNSCNEVVNLNPEDEKKISQKSEQEVRDFIANQYNFFSVGSIDVAKKTFAKDAIIIGTDESEFLVGWDKIKKSLMGQIEEIENPKFVTKDLKIVMSDNSDMASYSQILNFSYRTPTTESSSGVKYEINDIRNSGVIKKIDGNWKIVQIHWSIGVKGQVIEYEFQK